MTRIIRNEHISGALAFSFTDLEQQGAETLRRARDEAQATLLRAEHQARTAAERIRAEAEARGYADGHSKGLETARREGLQAAQREARETLARVTTALKNQVEEWRRKKHYLLACAETGVIELAIAIARRVSKAQAQDPAVAAANARAALALLAESSPVSLRMNPLDLQALGEHGAELLREISGPDLRLQPDETLARGDCILEHAHGVIDASLETQIERIAASLLQGASA